MNRKRLIFAVVITINALFSHHLLAAEEIGAKAVDAAWTKAMKANSVEAIMACYAADAIGWFPGEAEARGEKAIRATYEAMLAANTIKDVTFPEAHYKNAGNMSLGWGTILITVEEKASGKTFVWTARFTVITERRGNRWVYTVDHASAEPPAK